jgi:hypothetical protein
MKDAVILIARAGMGSAAPELQWKLLATYLRLLLENDVLPGAICFYTEGVRCVIDDSPVLGILRELEARGVHLVICKTCLEYYELGGRVQVGIEGGMGDIVAAQVTAAKVVAI